MTSTNSANPSDEHLHGNAHGGSDNMPFLPAGAKCCEYRTFIFKSKKPGEVIFGHTPDCSNTQSPLDLGQAKSFAIYPNGPFENSHPVMETISDPPILRRTPKWADDGKAIYWYIDMNEKVIKGLLHHLVLQKYEREKNMKEAHKSDDKKKGYGDEATQTDSNQATVDNEGKEDHVEKRPHHAMVFNADGAGVAGSGVRPRRMTRGKDNLRPQLQPLRNYPDHSEDNCENDDPEWYDRQQRRSEHDHLVMDSTTTLVARPPQSNGPDSLRESRHLMPNHLRLLNASNYRPPRVELYEENRNTNENARDRPRIGLRVGAPPADNDEMSDDGETNTVRERDCRCVNYMVRGYGQPLEPAPFRHQVICERHDLKLQSREAQATWAETDMKFGLRGGASQAYASQVKTAEEKLKREISIELEMMGGGYDAPVFAAVYEDKPEEKPQQTSSLNAPTSATKPAGNGDGQLPSPDLRVGGVDATNALSEASANIDNEPESRSLSDLLSQAKEIKTRFENSGPKTGRAAPGEERNRHRVTSFTGDLEYPYAAARPSNSGCERCVNLSHRRLERWDDQEIRKIIKGMQRDSNSITIRAGQMDVRKYELEDKEEMPETKEKTLHRKSRDLVDARAGFMRSSNAFSRSSSSGGDLEAKFTDAKPQPVDASTKAPTGARARVKSIPGPTGGASNAHKPITSTGAGGSTIAPIETRNSLPVKPEQVGMDEDQFEFARAYQLAFDYQQHRKQDQREILSSDYWTQYSFNTSSKTKQESYNCQDDTRKLFRQLDDLQDKMEQLCGRCYFLEQSNQPSTNYGIDMPRPTNFPAPPYYGYPAYPSYPQPSIMSHQKPQQLAPAPVMTAFPMYGGPLTRFKPLPSEQLLADDGPDVEEFMTQRQQRQTSESKKQALAEKKNKENDHSQSQTWDEQALNDAEEQDAGEQKKQEKCEEKLKSQKQALDRWTNWHC